MDDKMPDLEDHLPEIHQHFSTHEIFAAINASGTHRVVEVAEVERMDALLTHLEHVSAVRANRLAGVKELGDVCYWLTFLAGTLGFTLEDVIATNIAKLSDLEARGVIRGTGDNR